MPIRTRIITADLRATDTADTATTAGIASTGPSIATIVFTGTGVIIAGDGVRADEKNPASLPRGGVQFQAPSS